MIGYTLFLFIGALLIWRLSKVRGRQFSKTWLRELERQQMREPADGLPWDWSQRGTTWDWRTDK